MYNVSKFDIFTWIGCWRGTIEADLLPAGVMVAMGVAVLPMVTMVTAADVLTDAKLKWILIEIELNSRNEFVETEIQNGSFDIRKYEETK